ncbi:MAG: SMC-Scp complex subunit ScpB [Verrucomicrobia bacterium]|nr:SMC-Scp complex subunit ScpB [Verrucomicrobiota bacterium]MDA1066997.1 SMC-Scp complex subunit ScpB [Verrucomicrobiota bacterium]
MTEVSTQFNLCKVLEALLFSTSEPLSIKDIQAVISRFHDQAEKIRVKLPEDGESVLETHLPFPVELLDEVPALITSTQIREAFSTISSELAESDAVYEIQETNLGFRLVVKSGLGFWVRLLREDPKPMRLSQAAMETMAIIAYRQPVTRSEMESIRGVAVDSSLQKLVEYELVYVIGRAELPGRPVQYGTTDKFLEFTGITSLDELPSTDVLSPMQLDDWIKKAQEPDHLSDSDVGLPSNDDEDVEYQAAKIATEVDQDELDLHSPDDPIYEVAAKKVGDDVELNESTIDQVEVENDTSDEVVIEEVDEDNKPVGE